jgi:hypothetical protein
LTEIHGRIFVPEITEASGLLSFVETVTTDGELFISGIERHQGPWIPSMQDVLIKNRYDPS